jgi:hypothetical protein
MESVWVYITPPGCVQGNKPTHSLASPGEQQTTLFLSAYQREVTGKRHISTSSTLTVYLSDERENGEGDGERDEERKTEEGKGVLGGMGDERMKEYRREKKAMGKQGRSYVASSVQGMHTDEHTHTSERRASSLFRHRRGQSLSGLSKQDR